MTSQEFLSIDLPAILISMLSATVCAVLGNFLILRRQALIGDAISHVTLPGIVIGFLYSGSLSAMPILVGALGTVIISVGLIEIIQRAGRLDSGVAMGVVFTTMFAFGVVLLEQMDASNVHIDAEHALDPVNASILGVNMDDLLVAQPDYGEQALEIAEPWRPWRSVASWYLWRHHSS